MYPNNTTNKQVYFESSDESILEANPYSGYITAKKEGSAYLIVKSSKNDLCLW